MNMVAMLTASVSYITLSLFTLQRVFAQAPCVVNGKEIPCEEVAEQVGAFVGWGIGALAIILLIGLVSFIFWIMMLIHAISRPIQSKAVWIIVLLFTGILGAIIYYFAVKRHFQAPVATSTVAPTIPPVAQP